MLTISQVAAGANLATFTFYGAALLFKPAAMIKTVMRSDGFDAIKFGDPIYAIAQYLGAMYLSQGLRMLRALGTPSMLKADLMGVGVVQSLLCVTSLARLLMGIAKDSVTLSLPFGQGLMAWLAFAGSAAA